jgi:hypothetical protein
MEKYTPEGIISYLPPFEREKIKKYFRYSHPKKQLHGPSSFIFIQRNIDSFPSEPYSKGIQGSYIRKPRMIEHNE